MPVKDILKYVFFVLFLAASAIHLWDSWKDNGKRRSRVEGRRITFWIDTEQVEVEGSTVTLDAGGFGGSEGAKKLLGK